MGGGFSIFGSCVTRDAFSQQSKDPRLDVYVARSSIWSLFSPPLSLAASIQDVPGAVSAFERRMVEWDVTKSARPLLLASTASTLIVDLIDERFDLIGDGIAFATESASFRKLGLHEMFASAPKRIGLQDRLGSVDKLAMEFAQHLCANFDRIVIHKAYWALSRRDGDILVPMERADYYGRVNGLLSIIYAALERAMPGAQVVEIPEELRVADPSHRWGLAPFHYEQGYYSAFRHAAGIR